MAGSWVKKLLGTAAEGTVGVATSLLCPSAAASTPHHTAPRSGAPSEPSPLFSAYLLQMSQSGH